MDIFEKITPSVKQQSENTLPSAEKQQKDKSFIQIIDEGDKRTPLEGYTYEPIKMFITKGKLKGQIVEYITHLDYDPFSMNLLKCLKVAKYKNMDLTKIEIKENNKTFNLLEYIAYSISNDKKLTALYAKYLLANEPRFRDKKIIDSCMHLLIKYNPYKTRQLINKCDDEFLKLYKILIDNGAKTWDVAESLFSNKGELLTKDPNFIELLLYENDERINKKLLNSFYCCKNPEVYYPLLKEYGVQPKLDDLITRFMHADCETTLRYLIDNGVYKKQDITQERIEFVFVSKNIKNPVIINKVTNKINQIKTQQPAKVSKESKGKVATKQSLKASQEINRIFEEAAKNTDENTK
ncbi:MAG: hypothetical protein IJ332_02870 [Clostridia bacterium]|nr:hypothetical protein [Clostridia bacterium]